MHRIAVLEPDPDVRGLLLRLVLQLGHEPWSSDNAVAADALLVEPGDPTSAGNAAELVRQRPDLPVVCASIYPKSPETTKLQPVAYLTKPVRLPQLRSALTTALERD